MKINSRDIIDFLNKSGLGYSYIGKTEMEITGFSSIDKLDNNAFTWIKNKDFYVEDKLKDIHDSLIVISTDIEISKSIAQAIGFIISDNPKEIFFSLLNEFFPQEVYSSFISSKSVVDTDKIGANVYIGHNSFVGKDVVIGDNVVIKNNVSLEGKVIIGDNTIIHSGVVMGTDGFGYFQNEAGKNIKVPHYGGITIGSDAEIGANTCIEKGTLNDTIIGNNVKIDDLCHIGHNSNIGDNCSIVALSMLGGSSVLEESAYIAPGAMIMNQKRVGRNSLVGMGAVVTKDVKDNKVVAGVPAKAIRDNE